ncbi:MAG: hypothetical protein QOG54_2312 [Actinomycetota bacterium]|nr:hypothetical protein [Actinomycetota bacterium]
MNQKQLLVVFVVVGLALAFIVVLLVTGGAPSGGFDPADAKDDVTVDGTDNPPDNPTLADVVSADIVADGTGLIFEATMSAPIPEKIEGSGLDWRWEVIEGGATTWIVSASVDDDASAAILNQRTNYGASTSDNTLPGKLTVAGNTISIRLEQAAISGLPTSFNWTLATSLDGDRTEAESAVAHDSAPDTGIGQYPPP